MNDYHMLSTLLQNIRFKTIKAQLNESVIAELQMPLHVIGSIGYEQIVNQDCNSQNNLLNSYLIENMKSTLK
jgi:hypothetical protein